MSPSEEDEDDEVSFRRFSVLHFQGGATHTHITQRLREPLLRHEDEGDARVRLGRERLSEESWGRGIKLCHFLIPRPVSLFGGSYCVL